MIFMDLNVIEKVLYACSDVHNVKVVDMTIFREEEYQKIIECELSVAKQVVPIYGTGFVRKFWDIKLVI